MPPALVTLSYMPPNATQTIAWVGKGIVYDTGGLSIKGKVRHYCFKICLLVISVGLDLLTSCQQIFRLFKKFVSDRSIYEV